MTDLNSEQASSKVSDAAREARAREFAIEVAQLLGDDKCEHIVVLDVRNLSQVTDFVVVGSGTSDRQMDAALTHAKELGEEQDYPCVRDSGDERSTWLLADFVDVVVHLFEPNTRAHYDIEMLWGDAERVTWRRSGISVESDEG
ncbi:MAG: ribosome silencing factor [Planctomycetota bacterium]